MFPESIAHNFFNFIIKAVPLDSKQIHKVKYKRLSEMSTLLLALFLLTKYMLDIETFHITPS